MSETTNLKLKKHDNVTTNTNQFDVENYMNGNWDKIDEFAGEVNDKVIEIEDSIDLVKQRTDQAVEEINTDISNIEKEQTEQNESIASKVNQADYNKAMLAIQAELNEAREENESIKGVIPTTSNTGENVTLNNTASMRFKKLDIGGNSKQETRSGINLWNDTSVENKAISSLSNTQVSVSNLKLTKAGNYCIRLFFTDNTYATSDVTTLLKDSAGNTVTEVGVLATKNLTQQQVEEITSGVVWTNTNGLSTYASKTIKGIILVQADTFPEAYEQYGVMPSLEFPSEVEAVGQDVNLFDEEQITLNRYVDSNGFDGASVISNISGYIPVVPNAEYTLNYDTDGRARYVCFYNAEKQVIDGSTIKAYINQTITFKTTNDTRYIRFTYYSGATNVKLQKGTKATVWSPYNHGSANVTVCNKNRLDFSKWNNVTASHGTVEKVKNGLELTATTNDCYTDTFAYNFQGTLSKERIEKYGVIAKPNTKYTFSCKVNNVTISKRLYMFFADKDYNLLGSVGSATSALTAETPANCKYITVRVGVANAGDSLTFTDLQIEEAETATDYVEHKEQTFTVPVQQEMLKDDGFVKIDGTWKEKHTWGKYVITGKEGVSKHTSTTNNSFYIQLSSYIDVLPKCPENNSTVAEILCSHFPVDAVNTNVFKDKIGIGLTQLSSSRTCALYISVGLDGISTSDEFKAKLAELYEAGTPVTVYYKLETPIYLDCTEAQKAVLNQVEKAKSYEDVTHIYSTDEISPIFDVEAYQDLKALFNQTNVAVLEGGN